ncbi:hypothetical protein K1719_031367 [Acacia pycnantha]|nr:hypothetical protein K1719_031367 [Acacia pycnantha]
MQSLFFTLVFVFFASTLPISFSDLLAELNLEWSRCCPILAAFLFVGHACSTLEVPAPAFGGGLLPMMPNDSQKCVNSLMSRNIRIPQPNDTCDTVLCFCGIQPTTETPLAPTWPPQPNDFFFNHF